MNALENALEEAGRETLRHLEQLSVEERAAGGPCLTCRFGSANTFESCRHPFGQRGSFRADAGKVEWHRPSQSWMRTGMCGSAGKLHERAARARIAWRWAVREIWPLMLGLFALPFIIVAIIVVTK